MISIFGVIFVQLCSSAGLLDKFFSATASSNSRTCLKKAPTSYRREKRSD